MLFSETVRNWQDWGRVFQSISAFTPLAQEICRREGLPWQDLSPLTPGTNGVFRCGELVLKIFFPRESGLDPQVDFATELAASRQALEWGIPTPRVAAQGMFSDRYDFYYIVTQYSPGNEAGPWLRQASTSQREAFVENLRELLTRLNRPTSALPQQDLKAMARHNERLEKLAPFLREEVLARLESLDLGEPVFTHGDLTGENLLVKEDGSFVVIDWADAHLAPAWYELGPIAFELFLGDGELWKLFAGAAQEDFLRQLLDCCCLHDFGGDFLCQLAQREGLKPFRSLSQVEQILREKMG
ncbi:MAG: phosphotransferase family protein [Acutalibacter sp.]|jgi:Ser/Thr protein kinase RdoA (MazF antagonist)